MPPVSRHQEKSCCKRIWLGREEQADAVNLHVGNVILISYPYSIKSGAKYTRDLASCSPLNVFKAVTLLCDNTRCSKLSGDNGLFPREENQPTPLHSPSSPLPVALATGAGRACATEGWCRGALPFANLPREVNVHLRDGAGVSARARAGPACRSVRCWEVLEPNPHVLAGPEKPACLGFALSMLCPVRARWRWSGPRLARWAPFGKPSPAGRWLQLPADARGSAALSSGCQKLAAALGRGQDGAFQGWVGRL